MSSADTTTDDTTENEEVTETDERRQALLERIVHHLGDDVVDSAISVGHDLWIRVPATAWKRTHQILRHELDFKYFEFLAGLDWLPSPYGKSESAEVDEDPVNHEPGAIETGVAGGDTRFQVFSRLIDLTEGDLAVIVKADVPPAVDSDPDGDPGSVESIVGVYPGANWHERETHEMFGIGFEGHPHLEKLYLPTGFEGHPLRKDFPLLARLVKPWPGIVDVEPMPEDASEDDDSAEEGDDA